MRDALGQSARGSVKLLQSEVKRLRAEAQDTTRLVPKVLRAFQLQLGEDVGHDVTGDVLHDLVTHAGPLAEGEGREVGRSLEDSVSEEPLGVVDLRSVPVVRTEVHVVVVDEDDGVGGDDVNEDDVVGGDDLEEEVDT